MSLPGFTDLSAGNNRLLSSITDLTSTSSSDYHNVAAPISPTRLVLSAVGLFALLIFSYFLQVGIEKKIVVGLIRSSLQLFLLGYLLLNLLFSLSSPFLIVCYLLFMISIAALEATNRQHRTYVGHYKDSFVACLIGGGCIGLYGNALVFAPSPWWSPHVMIPTCGMIIGNSVSGPAIAVERLLSEVSEKSYEIETRLSFGASYLESILPIIRTSLSAALTPTLNQLAIIGLVSIPGMMTGQLIGGTPPLIAAEYQLAILYLITSTSAVSTVISIILAVRNAIFDLKAHRLTSSRIIKTKKTDIDKALYDAIIQAFSIISRFWKSLFGRNNSGGYQNIQGNEDTDDGEEEARSLKSTDSIQPQQKKKIERSIGERGEEEGSWLELPAVASSNTSLSSLSANPFRVHYEVIDNKARSTSSSSVPLLQLFQFNIKSGEKDLFSSEEALNLEVYPNEIITFEGKSGIGKTRLLRAITYLDIPYQGYCVYQSKFILSQEQSKISSSSTSLSSSRSQSQPLSVWSVPQWRSHLIYVPQSLSPLEGTPHDLLVEVLKYSSRKASHELLSSKLTSFSIFCVFHPPSFFLFLFLLDSRLFS
jgi:putative ABC transport system permease protein